MIFVTGQSAKINQQLQWLRIIYLVLLFFLHKRILSYSLGYKRFKHWWHKFNTYKLWRPRWRSQICWHGEILPKKFNRTSLNFVSRWKKFCKTISNTIFPWTLLFLRNMKIFLGESQKCKNFRHYWRR